ncbi:MAG TPA: ZmpA/ZmpB/ZmpC family metallo-endopeptidase-related protein, partial [Deinococcales bacterium]|nr:ZmpA/ZmpB/ZmpC family metallo-endopeptidase-related protein [Deinococcales bacterium]
MGELQACDTGDAADPADPCVITRVKQLQDMAEDGHYALGADIDASSTEAASSMFGAAGFQPVGTDSDPFSGTFDGQDHDITGLHIWRPHTDRVGLFGVVEAGEIEAVNLVDASVDGKETVGLLAGEVKEGSTIKEVTVSGGQVRG